jgi:adenine-specific DNA-methyltransferase
MTDIKSSIQTILGNFSRKPLAQAATELFDVLGYRSEKKFAIIPNSGDQFCAEFDPQNRLDAEKARIQEWRSVDLLFQITDAEIRQALGGQADLFNNGQIDGMQISSYLVFAIELADAKYSRTQLANITRQVNLLFPMPVLIVFRHGETISLGIITRRLNKRDASRYVLEKVTLIKDIRSANPHRAHLEILEDLSLPALASAYHITSFVDLQSHGRKP